MTQTVTNLIWEDVPLAHLPMPKGAMHLTRSLTSGLTQSVLDPNGVFWGVGDRGPNIKPDEAIDRYGLSALEAARHTDGAKVMPMPETGPALARFRLENGRVELEAVFPLRGPDGAVLGGLPPPAHPGMETEPIFGIDGTRLGTHVDGADCEGIVALPDGRFWIGEEYGPALLLVERDGTVVKRLVPQGLGHYYAGSAIPTEAALPALAIARKLNRGFEGLALSPDGTQLYVAFQSPLAHPDRAAHDYGDVVRIWALDATSGALISEYAYPLDAADSFVRDAEVGAVAASDVKISELVCRSDGKLLVLERITLSTKIYCVEMEGRELPATFCDPSHRPTLEQIGEAGLAAAGLPSLSKTLVFSTDVARDVCGDLEGMLELADGDLLLANDSDYGTSGAATEFWRVGL